MAVPGANFEFQVVKSTSPQEKDFVEGDASNASYFLAGAAVTGGTVTVEGCGTSRLQGDVKFVEVLEKMGAKVTWTENSVIVVGPPLDSSRKKCLRGIDVNMNKMSDVAMTLAVVALYADGPTAIRDVASWRVKETEQMIAILHRTQKAESNSRRRARLLHNHSTREAKCDCN